MSLYARVKLNMIRMPRIYWKKLVAVKPVPLYEYEISVKMNSDMIVPDRLTGGLIPRKIQQTNKNMELIINQAGASGHSDDFHAFTSVKRGSFCASNARWNRQFTKEMMIQFVKKEALVIEINQFKTVKPPAVVRKYIPIHGKSQRGTDRRSECMKGPRRPVR